MEKISVMIPTMNLDLVEYSIKSLLQNSTYEPEILVWDNRVEPEEGHLGVAQETHELWLKFDGKIRVFGDLGNIGIPAAYNRMAKKASNGILWAADDDYYYPRGWDEPLIEIMERDRLSSVTPHISRHPIMIEPLDGNPNTIYKDFGRAPDVFRKDEFDKFANEQLPWPGFKEERVNPNCPCAVWKDTWAALDGWDEDYFPGFGADPDFLIRLRNMGGKMLSAPNCYFYHFSGTTSSGMPRNESREMFLKKHGIAIKQFVESMRK